jgi:hypothetical protein
MDIRKIEILYAYISVLKYVVSPYCKINLMYLAIRTHYYVCVSSLFFFVVVVTYFYFPTHMHTHTQSHSFFLC